MRLQSSGKLYGGELCPLIRVEDLRAAMARQRLLQGLHTTGRVQRIGQPPRQYLARRPVHDRHQIQKAPLQRE